MCPDGAKNNQLTDGGFDWTTLLDGLDDRIQTSHLRTPAQTPNTGLSGAHTHFDWLDLWDAIQPPKEQSAPLANKVPPTPESLPKPTQTPSTPKTPFSLLSPSSPPPHGASFSSPASSVIQGPFSNTDRKPYISPLDRKGIVRKAPVQDDNPFLVSSPCLRKPDIPAPRRQPVLEVPYDWSPNTPTPVRFHPATVEELPSQPVFTSIGQLQGSSTKQSILWLTHMSTSGGLTPSLKRISLPYHPYPKVRGVSMFINHPKRRVHEQIRVKENVKNDQDIFTATMDSVMDKDWRKTSMVHGVYTVNLLSEDLEIRERSKRSVMEEMRQVKALGMSTLVIHLGSAGKDDPSHKHVQLTRLVSDLREITRAVPGITLALENTVHPSLHSLTTLSSLCAILTHFPPSQLKLCLDLSHLHVSEFDLNSKGGRKEMWELLEKAGKTRVVGVHVSDNYVAHGGKGDRHANIGFGHITLSSFRTILSNPFFHNIPHLLETPPYFKHFRPPNTIHCKLPMYAQKIIELESERASLERLLLDRIVSMSDPEWMTYQSKLWVMYKKARKVVEARIYKVLFKQGGGLWRKFRKERKKLGSYLRLVEAQKRKEKNMSIKDERVTITQCCEL
ncbi:hypothetical protein J008_06096 [Cryptococcus neoformans]|nr:hypothetical protein C367_06056 [Cryptococcus neoformans var. grubii Ze90-1]OXG20391.1 hypothetical protein C366_01924 [Cryptococcus neoformans var. grubii Tu401-1]OXH23422.1 hypothetical protein J008_06096 [Cryptococcus neoformans var. grubii]